MKPAVTDCHKQFAITLEPVTCQTPVRLIKAKTLFAGDGEGLAPSMLCSKSGQFHAAAKINKILKWICGALLL